MKPALSAKESSVVEKWTACHSSVYYCPRWCEDYTSDDEYTCVSKDDRTHGYAKDCGWGSEKCLCTCTGKSTGDCDLCGDECYVNYCRDDTTMNGYCTFDDLLNSESSDSCNLNSMLLDTIDTELGERMSFNLLGVSSGIDVVAGIFTSILFDEWEPSNYLSNEFGLSNNLRVDFDTATTNVLTCAEEEIEAVYISDIESKLAAILSFFDAMEGDELGSIGRSDLIHAYYGIINAKIAGIFNTQGQVMDYINTYSQYEASLLLWKSFIPLLHMITQDALIVYSNYYDGSIDYRSCSEYENTIRYTLETFGYMKEWLAEAQSVLAESLYPIDMSFWGYSTEKDDPTGTTDPSRGWFKISSTNDYYSGYCDTYYLENRCWGCCIYCEDANTWDIKVKTSKDRDTYCSVNMGGPIITLNDISETPYVVNVIKQFANNLFVDLYAGYVGWLSDFRTNYTDYIDAFIEITNDASGGCTPRPTPRPTPTPSYIAYDAVHLGCYTCNESIYDVYDYDSLYVGSPYYIFQGYPEVYKNKNSGKYRYGKADVTECTIACGESTRDGFTYEYFALENDYCWCGMKIDNRWAVSCNDSLSELSNGVGYESIASDVYEIIRSNEFGE